jgi:adenosylmethionine---8-amino-7-oxononanoate aminotransferase
VIARNREKSRRWAQIAQPLARHERVRNFRHRGMIVAFDVSTERPDFARWCFEQALEQERLLRPIGRTVYFMPPYVVADDEFALLVERTRSIVDAA